MGEFFGQHETVWEFTENFEKINEYRQKLFAEQKESIIFIFQATDAAGKDSAVRAYRAASVRRLYWDTASRRLTMKKPLRLFAAFWDAIPEKGSISFFNRSYNEYILIQKIHRLYEKIKASIV